MAIKLRLVVEQEATGHKKSNTLEVFDVPQQEKYSDQVDLYDAIRKAVDQAIKNFMPPNLTQLEILKKQAEQQLMDAIFGNR